MTISVGDILRVVAVLQWTDGEIAQNIFNAVITGAGGPFDDGDIVDDALDWMATIFANGVATMSDEIDGSQVQVYVYDPIDDDFDEVGTIGWTFNPSNAADQLPRGVAALGTCRTTNPDVQGKKFWAGLCEGGTTDGVFSGGQLTTILAMTEDWVTPFTGSTSGASWVPGIWSPKLTTLFHWDASYSVSAIPAYQRRRKQGVGV